MTKAERSKLKTLLLAEKPEPRFQILDAVAAIELSGPDVHPAPRPRVGGLTVVGVRLIEPPGMFPYYRIKAVGPNGIVEGAERFFDHESVCAECGCSVNRPNATCAECVSKHNWQDITNEAGYGPDATYH